MSEALLLECGHESEPPIGAWEPADAVYCSRCGEEVLVDELREPRRQHSLKRWSS